jgi:hypothetical protein
MSTSIAWFLDVILGSRQDNCDACMDVGILVDGHLADADSFYIQDRVLGAWTKLARGIS